MSSTTLLRLALILLGLAFASGFFAFWGLFTASGGRHFDEMAGFIPFFVGCAGGVLLVGAALAWWLAGRLE